MIQQKLTLTRINILVVGAREVGKTSLMYSFKNETFTDEPEDPETIIDKLHYLGDEKVLYKMKEVHGELDIRADDEFVPEVILLLYDNDEADTLNSLSKTWSSKINRVYSTVPIILVRTKCDVGVTDITTKFGKVVADRIHAELYFQCSAKNMNGIKFIFLEIHRILQRKKSERQEASERSVSVTSPSVSCAFNMVSNSGPLLRQACSNVIEVVRNPMAFTRQKRALQAIIPFVDFGVPDENSEGSEEKKSKKDDEKSE